MNSHMIEPFRSVESLKPFYATFVSIQSIIDLNSSKRIWLNLTSVTVENNGSFFC